MVPYSYRLAIMPALLLICGCYNPYPYHGWQGQPGYYPAQPGTMQSPGQLYIPPSDAPLAAPGGSTYDPERPDDFDAESNGSFFPEDSDGAVPPPRDSNDSDRFERDFNSDFEQGF